MEPTLQDLLDILTLQREYGASLDEKRLDDHLELYAPDAVLRVFGREYAGVRAIRAFMRTARDGKHLTLPPALSFEGDRAGAVADFIFYDAPDLSVYSTGIYRDELVRSGGRWRFARREIELQIQRPG